MEKLVYAVSTDLIVPLVTITGFLGFLKKDTASGNQLRIEIDLGLMGDAVERMEALLSKALELSSIGKLSKPREKVPFVDLVVEALSLASERIKSSGAAALLSINHRGTDGCGCHTSASHQCGDHCHPGDGDSISGIGCDFDPPSVRDKGADHTEMPTNGIRPGRRPLRYYWALQHTTLCLNSWRRGLK
jgi:hypothetical protein